MAQDGPAETGQNGGGSYLNQVLGWLRGGNQDPNPHLAIPTPRAQPGIEKAPSLPWYPTNQDANQAIQSGFGYGTGNEGFLDNQNAKVLGITAYQLPKGGKAGKSQETFFPQNASGMSPGGAARAAIDPQLSKNVDLTLASTDPTVRDKMQNVYMRAGLAANRIPIASVGFDPRRAVADVLMDRSNIAGSYSPQADSMYFNMSTPEPSALAHEATHRGMEQLRKQYPQEMPALEKRLPDEESVVRWLMKSQAGDPEFGIGGASDKQRNEAVNYFTSHPDAQNALQQVQELAQQAIKNRSQGHAH